MVIFPFPAVSENTGSDSAERDLYATSIGYRCWFLSPFPFHCATGENEARNNQMFQVVGSLLEVAKEAPGTKEHTE